MKRLIPYVPAVLLGLGILLLLGVDRQRAMPLRTPLSGIPTRILNRQGATCRSAPRSSGWPA